jgi:tetratricopeptide (TPR) repeat protein
MRVFWRSLLFVLVGVSAALLSAARFCRLDPLTIRMPHAIRSVVATLAVHENSIGPNALNRAITIDPGNAAAWGRRCIAYVGKDAAERLNDCRRAVALRATGANYRAEATALEDTGDSCAAEAAYRTALSQRDIVHRAYVLRDQARAALACGDINGSLAALKSAEEFDQHNLLLSEAAAISGRDGLAADRGYMSVVYEQMHQPQKAREMCSEANPGFGSCTCQLTGAGLSCSQNAPPSN